MIQSQRIKYLKSGTPAPGHYVLYWMQASQRAEYNHALEYAVETADQLHLPLVVFFGITGKYPGANRRHYLFMLEGLKEVSASLQERGIRFVARKTPPDKGALDLTSEAALLVMDRGYLRHQREWRRKVSKRRCGSSGNRLSKRGILGGHLSAQDLQSPPSIPGASRTAGT